MSLRGALFGGSPRRVLLYSTRYIARILGITRRAYKGLLADAVKNSSATESRPCRPPTTASQRLRKRCLVTLGNYIVLPIVVKPPGGLAETLAQHPGHGFRRQCACSKQMSFWGATVITSLASAIPIVGDNIVTWL